MTIGTPPSCDRLGQRRRVGDRVVLALVRERRADRRRPQPGDDRQLLLEALEALAERRERDRVRLVLALVPAGAEAELDAAAGHLVDPGDRDRQRSGQAERRRRDERAEADRRRVAGQAGERRPGVASARAGRRPSSTAPIAR